jgi:transcriptional regulator with XRE-family HTH domain
MRRIREEKGIRQTDIARELNLTKSRVSQFENGMKTTRINAGRVAAILGCTIEDLSEPVYTFRKGEPPDRPPPDHCTEATRYEGGLLREFANIMLLMMTFEAREKAKVSA